MSLAAVFVAKVARRVRDHTSRRSRSAKGVVAMTRIVQSERGSRLCYNNADERRRWGRGMCVEEEYRLSSLSVRVGAPGRTSSRSERRGRRKGTRRSLSGCFSADRGQASFRPSLLPSALRRTKTEFVPAPNHQSKARNYEYYS